MGKPAHNLIDDATANVGRLKTFWARRSFHDAEIESIARVSGRVVFQLDDHLLILTGVTQHKTQTDELPDVWLYEELTTTGDSSTLTITTETGNCVTTFRNLRLIQRRDYSVLIPELDR